MTEEDFDRKLADIFRAQQAILDDVALAEEFLQELQQELVNAEQITRRVLRR
jgi:phosphoenolpyruvate-protein kinase (PTS system EI component)